MFAPNISLFSASGVPSRESINHLVTTIAVNIETSIPMESVAANPRTIDVPIMNKIAHVIRVE